jgi:molybdopterin-guanine dinucleotide biosynthesis protein A
VPSGCYLIEEEVLTSDNLGNGPLLGFVQGLKQIDLNKEWVLLLACDLPQLTSMEVERWYEYLAQMPSEAIALLPRHPKGWEPLSGFYRRRCLPLLTKYIEDGGRSFQAWLTQQIVVELPVSDRQLLFNCNTPEDLEKLQRERE